MKTTEAILPETNYRDIAEKIAERSMRGWDLYLAKRQLITKTGEDTYIVPSCTGRGSYAVRYGSDLEECSCTDYGVHGGKLPCKHLVAVSLLYATRRRVRSTCEMCGISSHKKTLVGIRGDRRRGGPRWCLPHHPDSLARAMLREDAIQGALS
jgi:hypothetical protein